MQSDTSKTTVVHLCIDPQHNFLKQFDPACKASYPARWRAFADKLYETPEVPIPTIWIAYGSDFKAHAASLTRPTSELRNKFKIALPVKEHEDIFEKCSPNAFEGGVLLSFIKDKYLNVKTVLISGVSTVACVRWSIEGALDDGLNCVGLYDLMANRGVKNDLWHNDYLEEVFPRRIKSGRLRLADRHTFSKEIAQRPAALTSGLLPAPQT